MSWRMAGTPSGVAGTLMYTFGRPSEAWRRRAAATVARSQPAAFEVVEPHALPEPVVQLVEPCHPAHLICPAGATLVPCRGCSPSVRRAPQQLFTFRSSEAGAGRFRAPRTAHRG